MSESTSTELTPLNYLKIFFRRKELLIIPMFVGLIVGICTGIILPKQYMSSTIIMVEEGKSDNPLLEHIAVSTSVRQRMAAIRESMLGWNNLVKLVNRLEFDKDIKTPRELEQLITKIRNNIVIKLRGNNVIDLSYFGEIPETTQAVVKSITEIFIERNIEIQNQETADAISFIEEQLKVYRSKIKSAEIANLKDQLSTLLLDSTEEHPQVKQLNDQINAKEKELKAEKLEYYEDAVLDASTANPIIQEIKNALDGIGAADNLPVQNETTPKEYYKIMLLEKLDNVMARDVKVNDAIYNMLLQRLETAKITQRLQASKEGTKYTIVDPPRLPYEPVKPDIFIVAMIGLIAGAIVGFGLVVSFEFMDKSFIDVEDAKKFLGRPLLGAISVINTEENVSRQREKTIWLYSLVLIAGIVIVIFTKAISNFLN